MAPIVARLIAQLHFDLRSESIRSVKIGGFDISFELFDFKYN
ncbi:MAG: hypothetical protein ACJAUR_001448 [Ulvibacter sp.]